MHDSGSTLLDQSQSTNNEKQSLEFTIVKRNGSLVPFRRERIIIALEAAFKEAKNIDKNACLPDELVQNVQDVADYVVSQLFILAESGSSVNVEGIQDLVESVLMQRGYHDVARGYIIYRDKHESLRIDSPRNVRIFREDGSRVRFNPMKIASSIEEGFLHVQELEPRSLEEIVEHVNRLTATIVARAMEMDKTGVSLHVETIDNEIENCLMREGFYNVAKYFILKRADNGNRPNFAKKSKKEKTKVARRFKVSYADGSAHFITEKNLLTKMKHACRNLKNTSPEDLVEASIVNFYEGIKSSEVDLANTMAARAKIEVEPEYSFVAARLLLDILYRETMDISATDSALKSNHKKYFKKYISHGISINQLSPRLLEFDLHKLANAIDIERDDTFSYLGLQTLYDRYFIHENDRRLETPQIFWMRVAMGLALNEEKKNERAIEFYNVLSTFHFVSATPTLFNSGTTHSQLSSCYLSTISDDLSHIFKVISDDAQLSKWAGGLGNDWTNVRATGSRIKGTNGRSQGVVPFLKVANDTAVAVNQGGKRKGAMCAYLETWHLDIEDFLELRKNTGDERRRTHDMSTANWIPDLFMKRVEQNEKWTLFTPCDTPDLHDLYGSEFEKRYAEYEKMTETGEITNFKKIEAVDLWRKMLSMLFETGHPWITFKDPSNVRSPQDHVGVVHCSNLCTEILLNTSEKETAVCNLGSINLVAHTTKDGIDEEKLANTVKTAVRMLDNVVDINFYPTAEAKNANLRHRPIGLGNMGFQDALYIQDISYASHEAVKFADVVMEKISYYTILASSDLAKERGTYQTYEGSKWDRGLLPIDTIQLMEDERGCQVEMDRSTTMDWDIVRQAVKENGMRNSNTMAIAPTATIANITGVAQSIEPMYKHLFVKSNLSGEFTIPNSYLVDKLKAEDLWDAEMLDDLKYFDGSIQEIERIPDHIKQVYLSAFEIEPEWIIECASRRQKWLDMGQSLNLYLSEPSGKKLNNMYMLAWKKGLKTTYYLRSLAATQIEKSTTDVNKRGLQPRWMKNKSASSNIVVDRDASQEVDDIVKGERPMVCNMEEGCESCQ